ncbi:serine hydrolase domain-containing protein [Flexivirga meconopsidis]|uniref:serine hydrolase domain-containing protein n=1 Tax=Flexivirga meconopsidis TaxID=2977121 RepID=UPI0022406B3B|nr:serine hydrolase domain-containing protein [Flexivirga meconopsidis]
MVIRLRAFVALALIALFLVCQANSPVVAAADQSPESQAVERLRSIGSPSAAVAVVERDARPRQAFADSGAQTPFLVGSLSKSFTALAAMRLVDSGRLRLDDTVRSRLPSFTLADGAGAGITVRQLLTHTSGIGRLDGLERADIVDDAPCKAASLVRSLSSATLRHTPGSKYEYSDANYLVLGEVVAAAYGAPYPRALRALVLDPLGMTETITTPQEARAAGLSAGHRWAWGGARDFDLPYVASGLAYGYVASTITDLTRYARAELTRDPKLLSAGSWRLMQSAQVRTGPTQSYGFGWRITQLSGLDRPVIEHTGATPGSFAHLLISPDTGRAVVVLADVYSEALAPALAQVGPDVLRRLAGSPAEPGGIDPVLRWLPWALAGLAAALLAAAAFLTLRRVGGAAGRWVRTGVGVLAALAAVLAWLAPSMLLGVDWQIVRLWSPDVAQALIALLVVGVLATAAMVFSVLRGVRSAA